MKTLTLFLILVCLGTLSFSQKATFIPILFGNEDLGYPLKTDTIGDEEGEDVNSKVPVLMRYVNNKQQYIGGVLEDETKNRSTVITDIQVVIVNDSSTIFQVYGEEFNCFLTTEKGYLLDTNSTYSKFAQVENHILIWAINKK